MQRTTTAIKLGVGQRFGKLQVLGRDTDRIGSHIYWLCECDCGNVTSASGSHLQNGGVKSCGCLKQPHGHTRTGNPSPEYRSWHAMKTRCENVRNKDYKKYGAIGIRIYKPWSDSFASFLKDVGPRPSGTTIDRFPDRRGNYEPGNVRWATNIEQGNNKISNIIATIDGETATVVEWCRKNGLPPTTAYRRIERGMSPEEAVTKPRQDYPLKTGPNARTRRKP